MQQSLWVGKENGDSRVGIERVTEMGTRVEGLKRSSMSPKPSYWKSGRGKPPGGRFTA